MNKKIVIAFVTFLSLHACHTPPKTIPIDTSSSGALIIKPYGFLGRAEDVFLVKIEKNDNLDNSKLIEKSEFVADSFAFFNLPEGEYAIAGAITIEGQQNNRYLYFLAFDKESIIKNKFKVERGKGIIKGNKFVFKKQESLFPKEKNQEAFLKQLMEIKPKRTKDLAFEFYGNILEASDDPSVTKSVKEIIKESWKNSPWLKSFTNE